ncbi:MAG: hypothetical protein A2622_07295 [Bdellovibrionales bacterium RIFCSPHIGHO2_01_FULL_40_29]|nr:MAG: hypothetical protein A2622_07295 [Bdellovibrionales bacterium RIFCSPHIGHO2_01_FULL_40_29]OFZ33199.1 MAG: hypothetical protein A3D17_11485 [Bdellovibrionales bacterium RIFCSPHIGHO2_02_FULL_40_15]
MKILFITTLLVFASFLAHAQGVGKGRYIGLQSGYGILSSGLSGSGFNSDLPGRGGLLYGIDFSYQNPDSETQYDFKYDKASVDQTAPLGVTPASLSIFREEFRFIISILPWDFGRFENLRIGFGYSILQTGATDTLPNNILTKQSSQGLLLNATYRMELEFDWSMQSEFLIYLPHQITESQQITGYNPKFIGAEFKFLLETPLSDDIIGFFGTSYRIDQVSYDGFVSRGVTSGQDTRTQIAIPIGIKIGY